MMADPLELLSDLRATESAQMNVQNRAGGKPCVTAAEERLARVEGLDRVSLSREKPSEAPPHRKIVVDNGYQLWQEGYSAAYHSLRPLRLIIAIARESGLRSRSR
jgi:hypothetical protein